jgi:hypothetical protein
MSENTYAPAETEFTHWLVGELTERYAPGGRWAKFFAESPLTVEDMTAAARALIRTRARYGFASLWDDFDADDLCADARDIMLVSLGLSRADTWEESAEVLARTHQR